jgi:hypothetical protein
MMAQHGDMKFCTKKLIANLTKQQMVSALSVQHSRIVKGLPFGALNRLPPSGGYVATLPQRIPSSLIKTTHGRAVFHGISAAAISSKLLLEAAWKPVSA